MEMMFLRDSEIAQRWLADDPNNRGVFNLKRAIEFPDESTADQFIEEKQFEAYRELGYQLGSQLDQLP